ncbi:retrovirus-related pol polyprotein LINE-1, partial [Tanacetum coccineum]
GKIESSLRDGNLRSCIPGRGGLGGASKTRRVNRVETFQRIRVGSWHVGSLTGKLLELADALERHKVDIALCLKDKVVQVNRCSDRIISLTLVIDGETVNVISAYAPQVGLSKVEKKTFWDSLDKVVREFPTDQRLIVGGDLNGHIGATTEGYAGLHGGFGYGVRNEEGRAILDFAIAHDLVVVKSHFKKRDHHLAFKSRVTEGVSTRVEALAACDTDSMWNTLASIIKDAAKDNLGVAMGTSKTHTAQRESWWLCEEVQSIVAVTQAKFRELLLCQEGNEEERLRAHKRIAKAKERRKRDTWDICFIKDEEGRTITDEEEIRKRWGEYFSSLFNARAREGQEEGVGPSRQPHPECYFSRISQAEVKTALQKMGRNKVVGPNQIPIEAWRCLGDEGTFWLTSLFNKIFTGAKMPEEWRLSKVIPIFKNKGDAQVCSNYRGIKLLGHTMKLWERVIERRLQRETLVSKNQFGFMPGRSSVEAIHLIRSLMEKYRKRQRDLHMAFLDLEKAYDSVPRELIWKTLVDKGASRRYIKVIRDMYDGAKTRREVLEDNDLRVSREKTEYLRCDFGNGEIAQNEDVDICIGDKILQPKESFRYLGSMLHKFGRIDEDVSSRIKAAWMKWRAATGVLCVWTLRDMIPNRVYRVQLEVETIINKMREGRLRWFGHVRRRSQSTPVRRVKDLVVDGLRRRGKPKLRWEDRVKQDMKELLLSEDMTSDRIT